MIIAINGRRAGCVSILPYAETMVDKAMMHPEDRVAGTSRNIRHNGANTIVPISMRTIGDLLLRVSSSQGSNLPSFSATFHIGVRAPRIARVDKTRVALRGQGLVNGA